MNESTVQVKDALRTMYSNSSEVKKMEATKLLESFQKSSEAWEITHSILVNKEEAIELRLFAAQTLRAKVTYDLSQIELSLEQFKDSLVDLLLSYPADSDRLVRTQLCVALAQLSLQYLQWSNPISEIINKIQNSLPCLLDFLKVLPEELLDIKKTPLTDEEFSQRTKELISANAQEVLLFLKNLSESSQDYNSKLLGCFNNWITEYPIEEVLQIEQLMSLLFQSLTKEDTFDNAIECLCTILRETRDIDNYQLIEALYQKLLEFNSFMMSDKQKLEDPDIFNGFTRLFVEACESWHVLIAKNPFHFKPLVSILLECTKYDEDLDVVKYTFYFWYMLKQLITLPNFKESREAFRDIYTELISVIINHLAYPTDAGDDDLFNGDREQEDKFKEFRYEMGDVLKDCCAVIGANTALSIPFEQIKGILTGERPNTKWQYLEAPLFSLRAMAKEVPLKEDTKLPIIMNLLIQLPDHQKIRYAATLVLGRYTEWTSCHPEFLEPQINYIVKGFEGDSSNQNNDIVLAASHALMYFCHDCSELMLNYLEQLYMLYCLIKDKLEIDSIFKLVDGLAHVIKKIPRENMYQTFYMFIKPTLEDLEKMINENNTGVSGEQFETKIADQIEIITIFVSILKCTEFEQPDYPVCSLYIEKIWPLSKALLQRYGSSLKISEHLLKLTKNAVRSFSTYLNPIISDIASILHSGFRLSHFGCYLWVSGVLISEFGDEFSSQETKQAIFEFGLTQCSQFFELIQHEQQNIKNMPDTVEDFFRMTNDLLMFFPSQVCANFQFLVSLLQTSILTLNSFEQFEPIISCLHFLVDLISWGMQHPPISFFQDDHAKIQALLKQFLSSDFHGRDIMDAVLKGLIFRFPPDAHQDANDLLLKLLTVLPDLNLAITWLSEVAISLPNVRPDDVNKLISTLTVSLQNKDNRRIRVSLKDFVGWYTRKNVGPRTEFF